MTPLAISAVLALAVPTGAAAATDSGALYPAAQCAALWYGYGDYARISRYLDGETAAYADARDYRSMALALHPGPAAEVDAFIAEQRPLMALMMEAYIYGRDRQSQELFEDLSQICSDFADTHPETRTTE